MAYQCLNDKNEEYYDLLRQIKRQKLESVPSENVNSEDNLLNLVKGGSVEKTDVCQVKDILRHTLTEPEDILKMKDEIIKSEPEPTEINKKSGEKLATSKAPPIKSKNAVIAKLLSTQKSEWNFEPINCWWEQAKEKRDNIQWEYLEHHGLMFTPAYVPHRVPILVNQQEIVLEPATEEIANYWCQAMFSDYGTKEIFIKNFWNALLQKLEPNHPLRKARFEDVDFSNIKNHLETVKEQQRMQRKAMTREDREAEKVKKEVEEGHYSQALLDWLKEKVGTFKAEPPSLFRGRGEHPRMGVLKRRIFPEEVTINVDEDAPVPSLPQSLMGHCWKDVFHDNTVSWLNFYQDTVNGQFKYTFLSPSSAVKGQKDYMKYEKARMLKNYIGQIRQDYTEKLKSNDMVMRQLGTATYMLDVLALRVGNEKDSAEEADTVGCCSLRVEHIQFTGQSTITLDFLGKDSIRYLNTVKIDPLVTKNLQDFVKNKKPDQIIFDSISTGTLNKYLKEQMSGLSAKVFRTYNASATLQNELDKLTMSKVGEVDITDSEAIKHFYESANREVAILCNHQRSIPKQHESSMEKMQAQFTKYKYDLEELLKYQNFLKTHHNSNSKFQFVSNASDDIVLSRPSVIKEGMKPEAVERSIHVLRNRLKSIELKIKIKDTNKTVSNTTSKQHYMDPRITVAFCKKWEVPIEKLFNATLRKKFPWAMYARSNFSF